MAGRKKIPLDRQAHRLVDENEFFRQAALRICGSLDIGKAMADLISYIRGYIPVAELSLTHFDPGMTLIQNLVTINASGKQRVVPPIVTPPELVPLAVARLAEWRQTEHGVRIEKDSDQEPLLKIALPYYETADPAVMSMHLVVDGVTVGVVGLFTEGYGAFTPTHARLFGLLREPFAIAMSNALRYEEVLRLKDMVDAENRELSRELHNLTTDEIIGAEYGLAGVMEMVRQVSPLTSPVMILGETGVGKEVIANAVHNLSPRRDAPFIKVNCGAIPENLIDAELFGHEKGAFTGAIAQKRGRFERADKGSIFLDEIAELPLQAQVRLLRVLQHKEIERVGGTQTIPVDVRIIAATNRNLGTMIRDGLFREDLWYRLNIFPIMIPPLRQHPEDIPALAYHFLEKKSKELKIHTPPSLSGREMERLKAYHWPGNVRELENLIERELILKRGADENHRLALGYLAFPLEKEPADGMPGAGRFPLPLDEAMRQHILDALSRTKGKIHGAGGAAELLQINPNTLRSRMKKLGIPLNRMDRG